MLGKAATLLAIVLSTATAISATELSGEDLDKRRFALRKLLEAQWEYTLSTSPEFASILGDKRWNDQVSDFSDAAIRKDLAKTREFLTRFKAIDTTGFQEQEALNRDLMIRNLEESLDGAKFEPWLTPVNQMSGIHLFAPQLASMLDFSTRKDYDDYTKRLRQLPRLFDEMMGHMRDGMKKRVIPPKFLLEKVTGQAAAIADRKTDENPFAAPLGKFPGGMSEDEQAEVRKEVLAAIDESVIPAYRKFEAFVRDEYAPAGRTEVGMWSMPRGVERYALRVKESTTTSLTPEEIHQIGLGEVTRIEGEMLVIAKKLGYDDLKTFNESVEKNADLKAKSGEQILDLYRKYTDQMYAKLPQLFGRLPKMKVEVKPMESYREQQAASAEYNQGSPDGSRPGRVRVNTYDATNRKLLTVESTAYHEGVPGHHMQISIAQELPTLPPFRQQGGHTAYIEGWALYSESLGKEVGFYQDPYSDYGHLQDEMLRAIRLVVDTGLHYKKWSRQDVVDFFHAHSAIDEVEVQSETDRYIVWPGQALGYKIGQLKILELRERAKKKLGDKFDLRAFHDEVLGAGSLPLDVLEARIDRWIAP